MPTTSGDSQFGSFVLSPRERRLLQNGQEVPLTPKAFDTLLVLVSNAGQLVEKQDLMKAVWGEVFVDDSTLTQNIFTLRNALGDREFIETVPRRGYRFTAPVTTLEPPSEPVVLPTRTPKIATWIATAFVGAVAALVLVAWVYSRQPYNPLDGAPPLQEITNSGRNSEAVISPDGKFIAYLSENNGSYDIMMLEVGTGNPYKWSSDGWSGAGPNLVRDLSFTWRGWVWNRPAGGNTSGQLQIRSRENAKAVDFLEKDASLPTWSPDGKRVVYIRTSDGDPMFITDGEGLTERIKIHDDAKGNHNHPMAWSSDSQWIYFTSGQLGSPNQFELYRIRPTGKDKEQLTHLNSDVAFPTPIDDRTILYLARDKNGIGPGLWSFDLKTRTSLRITAETKQFIGLSGSADGRSVVVTLADPQAQLWSVPILTGRKAEDADAKEFVLPGVQRALSPNFIEGSDRSLFFLSSNGGGDGLWHYRDGKPIQIWNGSNGALFEPPVISRDGKKFAIKIRTDGRATWNVGSVDGSGLKPVGEDLEIVGNATWNPEGTALLAGVSAKNKGGMGLVLIPADGSAPTPFFSGFARNPVWSPQANLIVYTGPPVKGTASLLALTPTGTPVKFPEVPAEGIGQQSARFLPDGKSLIYRRQPNFWHLDLTTRKIHQLTDFKQRAGNFDIAPDGASIVFDRPRSNSDIYLISIPPKPWYRQIF